MEYYVAIENNVWEDYPETWRSVYDTMLKSRTENIMAHKKRMLWHYDNNSVNTYTYGHI